MEQIQEFLINLAKTKGADIAWIIALFFIGRAVLKKIVYRVVKFADDGQEGDSLLEQRAKTLGNIIITTGNVVIYVIVLLMVLKVFGMDITPILAGAGIIGLAIGFGAQTLVKDFVSGIFILIENQYGIGDKVKIAGAEGKVIRITVRSTVIRGDGGETYFLSNGFITGKEVINYSRNLEA